MSHKVKKVVKVIYSEGHVCLPALCSPILLAPVSSHLLF